MKNRNKNSQWVSMPKIINKIPGSLVYQGNKTEPFKISIYTYDPDVYEKREYKSVDELINSGVLNKDNTGVKWINVTGINHIEEIKQIQKNFKIPQLVLEQVLEISKHSSYKISAEILYSDLQMIYVANKKVINENIGILMIGEFVFTFQEREGDVFDSVRERIEKKMGAIRERDIGYSYFCLLDAIVDHYMDALNWIERQIELMEELVIEVEPIEINAIHEVRKQLMVMKFSVNPIDKLIQNCLSSEKLGIDNHLYLESLSNHIKDVQSIMVIQKEMIDSIYENYILNNSNDMNKIMTTLTIFSAVFIPLSFLAGVFGMNFEYIPGLLLENGFYYFVAGCLISTVFMISFFKLKNWF